MNPQDLPLEPLIAPPAVSWWPLAPIWWILIALIIIGALVIIFFAYVKPFKKSVTTNISDISINLRKTAALAELAKLAKPYDKPVGPWLQQVNILLKRLCNISYPSANTHTLLGEAWLEFLDSHCPEANLKQYPILVEGLYRDNYYLENGVIDSLYTAVKTWINDHV